CLAEEPKPKLLLHHNRYPNSRPVECVRFSPDGKVLASASTDGTIKIWEIPTGKELRTLTANSEWVESVAFHPDGQMLASGSWDRTVKLWDVATGQLVGSSIEMERGWGGVNCVAFSPDGKTIASTWSRNEVKLWEVGGDKKKVTLKERATFKGDTRFLAF